MTISHGLTELGLIVVVAVHWGWLLAIHHSENCDKKLWVQYRGKALLLADPEDHSLRDGGRPWYKELVWLGLEGGMTAILSLILFSMLFWRCKP